MSKKKKIFVIVYVIALIAIITLQLSKIIAAENTISRSVASEKTTNMGSSEATHTKTLESERIIGKEDADTYVLTLPEGGVYLNYLQNDESILCLDKDVHIYSDWTANQQLLRKTNGLQVKDFHIGENIAFIPPDETEHAYVPLNGKKFYMSREYNWSALRVDECSEEDIVQDDDGNVYSKKSYAAAYILSTISKETDEYDKLYVDDHNTAGPLSYEARQWALWDILNGTATAYTSDKPEAKKLYEKANAYGDYRDTFQLPSLKSTNSKYKFKYVRNNDYFIAGPIEITYPVLKLSTGDKVGEMYNPRLYATDNNGNNIELARSSGFEITDASGNKINLPESGGSFEFYIKVDNSTVKSKQIREITDFKVNFKYMEITARGYKVHDPDEMCMLYYNWNPDVDPDEKEYFYTCEDETYEIDEGDCEYSETDVDMKYPKYRCYYCNEEEDGILHRVTVKKKTPTKIIREDDWTTHGASQPLFVFAEGEIKWEEYELKITFEEDQRTYVNIGGKVWIDNQNGSKENEENKVFDNGEYGRPNVLVKLYFWDGTPVKVGVKEVIADKRNNKLVHGNTGNYEMYTDENGDYMFYGLPINQKYYVEFTYDGSTYIRVEYLAGGSESDYLNDPNQEKYDNNSKVKNEYNRDAFNKKFETITYKELGERAVFVENGTREDGTAGKASGTNDLKYLTRENYESGKRYIKSKILTTREFSDVDTDRPKGEVIDPHKITARTGENLKYPFEKNNEILIWSADSKYTKLEGNALHYLNHVNLGLRIREKADFALTTQLKAGAMTIKDKEKVVFYSSLVTDDALEIDGTTTQDEYIKQEISASDYYWKEKFTKIYGEDGNAYYVLDEDRLNVYVLYRIVVKDQCEDADDFGVISEIIDHYDNRLERVTSYKELSKASALFREKGLNVPAGAVESWIEGTNTRVTWNEITPLDSKYTTMKTEGLNLEVGKDKSTSAIYLILKVKENGDILNTGTDNDTDGIQNIAEIGEYSVYHKDGSSKIVTGKIDKDSAPGNATPGDKTTYEDDTDAAPMFRLEMNWAPRKIEGYVWDDVNKDGIMNSGSEKGIENVTVKLVEYITDDEGNVIEIVERPGIEINGRTLTVDRNQHVKTNRNGHYEFYVEGGNYALKFIYGNTEMLHGVSANKKYNAQDYQATAYSALSSGRVNGYNTTSAIPNPNAFATSSDLEYAFKHKLISNKLVTDDIDIINKDNAHSKWETAHWKNDTTNKLSSARDNAKIRANIIQNTNSLQYDIANMLDELNVDAYGNKSVSSKAIAQQLSGNNNRTTNYTYMESNTDIITIASNDLVGTSKVINLGLKERLTASRTLEKTVKRIVLKTNDGVALIDTADSSKLSGMQLLDGIQHTYINMDSNKIDGATLDIDYEIVVKNDSAENDRLENYVYVDSDKRELEKLGDLKTPLPVRATIFDYVNINLEYRAADNVVTEGTSGWKKVYDNDTNTNSIPSGWLSGDVTARLPRTQKYVSKVMSTKTKDLLAGQSITIPIHLGITLSENTGKNDANDFDFSNCAEVVQVDSPAGRRDYDTVPGNDKPYDEPNELDEDLTGRTSISPPLGQERIYYVITIVSATIVIAGIILIKKKVLKK